MNLDEDNILNLAELFKMFSDSTRLNIINTLLNNELCVNEICTKINSSQSAVSHQLRLLKAYKLIKSRKDGNLVYYSLADDHVEKIFKIGCEHINEI